MKINSLHILLLLPVFFLGACHSASPAESGSLNALPEVSAIRPVQMDVTIFNEYQGITRFFQPVQIRAQLTGLVRGAMISVGDRVSNGQSLFIITTREGMVLSGLKQESDDFPSVSDTIRAGSSLTITMVNVLQGDFVQEGDLLATGVKENSIRIVGYIPVEENTETLINKECEVEFPDASKRNGKIVSVLPVANANRQVNEVLIELENPSGIAENIRVRIKVANGFLKDKTFLPLSALYANEEMNRFWILKIVDDSLAVRVPVERGQRVDSLVMVSYADTASYYVFKGGYALDDSIRVTVMKEKSGM